MQVWLNSISRVPLPAIQGFCKASQEYCPPGRQGKKGEGGLPGLVGKKGDRGLRGDRGDKAEYRHFSQPSHR